MEFDKVLGKRHSVRKFSDRKVPRELLDGIVAQAALAPSSKNSRSSGFVIVEDKATIETLSRMRDRGSSFMAGAPAAIVVTGDASKTDLWAENSSISATYVLLSVASKGLGGCWVHVAGRKRSKSDPDSGWAEDYVKEILGIPEGIRVLCVVAVGYEAGV